MRVFNSYEVKRLKADSVKYKSTKVRMNIEYSFFSNKISQKGETKLGRTISIQSIYKFKYFAKIF